MVLIGASKLEITEFVTLNVPADLITSDQYTTMGRLPNLFVIFVMLATFSASDVRACAVYASLTFGSQGGLADYFANAPCPIDSIMGNLRIGPGVTSLDPLLGLKFIGGFFIITASNDLLTLSGLDSLYEVDDNISISAGGLSDLRGLQNLRHIGRSTSPVPGYTNNSKGIRLEMLSVKDLNFLASGTDLHNGRISLQARDLENIDIISTWKNINDFSLYQCDSIRNTPRFPNIHSLNRLYIAQCSTLTKVTFSHLDTITSVEIERCPKLDTIEFSKGLTFAPGVQSNFRNERVHDATLDISLPNLRHLHLPSYNADTAVRQLSFFLNAPVSELPNMSGHNFYQYELFNVLIEGNLDLRGDRNHTRWIYASPSLTLVDVPLLDTVMLPNNAGTVGMARMQELKAVLTDHDELNYTALYIGTAPSLESISILSELSAIDPYHPVSLSHLDAFEFQTGNFDLLQRAGAILFDDLPSITNLPTFSSLDTVLSVGLRDIALSGDMQLFEPHRTHLALGIAIIQDEAYTVPGASLRINSDVRSLTRRGRYEDIDTAPSSASGWLRIGQKPAYSGIRLSYGANRDIPSDGGANLTLLGLDSLRHVSEFSISDYGSDVPPPSPDWVPHLETAGGVFVASSASEHLGLPARITKLTDRSDLVDAGVSTDSQMLRLFHLRNLTEARALCPLVESGTIVDYLLEQVAPPFDTPTGLLRYCDTVSTISTTSSNWQAFQLYPTVQRPGGVVNVVGLDDVPGHLRYQIYGAGGQLVSSGTLVESSTNGGRAGLLTVPHALATGSYWVTVQAPSTGQRATGVIVVGEPRP